MGDDRSSDDGGSVRAHRADDSSDANSAVRVPDDEPQSDGGGLSRRALLARGGVVLGGVAVASAAGAPAVASAAAANANAQATAAASEPVAEAAAVKGWANAPLLPFRFFSGEDTNVIGAMADRIYPRDKLGPGATDLGVVEYIDGQLAGAWGSGERMYRQGPFFTPTTTGHGWQYAMTPSDAYRVALDSLNAYTAAKFQGNTFDSLTTAQQDKVLTDLASGATDLESYFDQIAAADFFSLFYANVKEGLFADPSYGGNRGVGGWKLVRYPGDPMSRGDTNYKYVLDYNYYPPGPPLPAAPGV